MQRFWLPLMVLSCLLLLGAAPFSPPLPAGELLWETTVDLNGDGRPERVRLTTVQNSSRFTLWVDDQKISGFLGGVPDDGDFAPDGFLLVDLDTADRYKEIAVHSPGPSDDDEYLLFWYDGKVLRQVGKVSRWPTFVGNGIVLADDWQGFWARRKKYVLDRATHQLRFVPQEFYWVGVQATVKTSFPLYYQRNSKNVVANLLPASKIDLLVCDLAEEDKFGKQWYLIRSTTGLVGWARLDSFQDKVQDLPWAD